MNVRQRPPAAVALRGPFGFFQTAYVTSDLDRAMSEIGALYGVTRFQVNRKVEIETLAGTARAHFALVFIGGQQLEIIEPAGGADGAYRDALPPNGYASRLHHFGQLVTEAAEWEAVRAAVVASELPVPVAGTFCHEGVPLMHYLYADTRPHLGHCLEYMYRTVAGRDIFAQVPRY
jgi:Glyoxalase/Bleomycin resistance protein/Dioxygenase superfamily